jgi:hypothetical protein
VSKHCTKTKELVEQAIVASDRQDFPQMLQYSEEAKKYWKSHDKILTAILRHDDSGDVGIGLAKMVSFARMQDEEEFRAVCVEVIEHLSHIQEQELPLLENIF